MWSMNSARVLGLSANVPSRALVRIRAFDFFTPRMAMHMCSPSTTTATPNGCTNWSINSAICRVIRS